MAIELASVGKQDMLRPRIIVVGVGGGGCNAINNMIESNLQGIEFLAANTDAQSLQASKAQRKLQLGNETTAGLGSGAQPEVGRRAAQESAQDIRDALEGCNMLFIAAGMGGGTGTGAAPVFAEIAESMGILTIAVVTKPFEFEGAKRMQAAADGLQELQKFAGTLIVIPNQNLFRIANDKTTFSEAFKMADEVLCSGVRSITDLIIIDGLVNLDFADIRTVMSAMGKAMMGTGEAEGDERSLRAAEAAITNPLLEDSNLRGAKEVMVNITAGRDVGLHEIDEAIGRIRREAGEEAYVHFGAALDETMHGIMRISVVATGIEGGSQQYLALDGHMQEKAETQQTQQTPPISPISGVSPYRESSAPAPIAGDETGDEPNDDTGGIDMPMVADSGVAGVPEPSPPSPPSPSSPPSPPSPVSPEPPVQSLNEILPDNDNSADNSAVAETKSADELHNALQWNVSGGNVSEGNISERNASQMSSSVVDLMSHGESPSSETPNEASIEPTQDVASGNSDNIGAGVEAGAFIPPAAHKVADSGIEDTPAFEVPMVTPGAASASSDGDAPDSAESTESGADTAVTADTAGDNEKSADEGKRGGIFARWRSGKNSASDSGTDDANGNEADDEAGEEMAAHSVDTDNTGDSGDSASPNDAHDNEGDNNTDKNTGDEEVVMFPERRFLPEDEVASEMHAVAEEEEDEDSNLLRIPAFLRR